jgi:DNA gyrase/topoisomerase IV subunit A
MNKINNNGVQGSTLREYPISKLASNEWRDFALYTIESRAIPNMIDGFKPSQKMYIYSSIVNSSKEFKKVSAIAGIVSDYGYNHSETSMSATGQLMAADWNNNLCLVEGRGSFGTRLIQEAGAPRYVYTRLNKNFYNYIKDIDLCPEHPDPEHLPPKYYIPVIPLVLVNGAKGIATGFSTNILPRSVNDIKSACLEYIKTKKIKNRLPVSFPQFNGHTEYDVEKDKFICYGKFTRVGKTKLIIDEVPYGYDRETYVKILDDLEENGDIISYDDRCNSNGFDFEIKLKQHSSSWSDEKIIKEFKLSKPYTENITVIDQNNKLREYKDERDLIKDFCDFRIGILQQRITKRINEYNEINRFLNVKMQFIKAILENKIIFKNKSKNEVIDLIKINTSAIEEDFDKLLRINILQLTSEMVLQLQEEIEKNNKELDYWKKTSPTQEFISDIKQLT